MVKHYSIYFMLLAVLLSSLACRAVTNAVQGKTPTPLPTSPPTTTLAPVSTEAVEQLVENVQQAAATLAASGATEITITQEQLNSAAVTEMQALPEEQQVLQELQITLHEGQMLVSGQVSQSGVTLPMEIVLSFSVGADGMPHSQVLSAQLGPLPLPQSMLDDLTSQLDQAILEQFEANAGDLAIDEIAIHEGYMTIRGHLR